MTVLSWLQETNIQAAVIGPFVTTILGVIGYLIHQHNVRKCQLAALIQEIEELALEHWCSPGADTNNHFRAIKIYGKIKTLSWRIDQEKLANRKALIAYRKAVTSGNFDDPTRTQVPFEDPRIKLIHAKAKDLRKTLSIKKSQ